MGVGELTCLESLEEVGGVFVVVAFKGLWIEPFYFFSSLFVFIGTGLEGRVARRGCLGGLRVGLIF